MDTINGWYSTCKVCNCHSSWHNMLNGKCHYNRKAGKLIKDKLAQKAKFGECEGCTGYIPSDNLEYLEFKCEQRQAL